MHLDQHQTSRLRFRKLTMEDLDPLMEFFNDPVATEYFDPPVERKQWGIDWINRQLGRYEEDYGMLALELIESKTLIGQCGLIKQKVLDKIEWEVGYNLIPRYWNNGYATEAAIYTKQYALENKLAETIISMIHVDNINSQKVAIRNGMEQGPRIEHKGFPIFVYRTKP